MNRSTTIVLYAVILTCLSQIPLQAAKGDIETDYRAIVEHFDTERWVEALQAVEAFRREHRDSERESSVTLIAAEAALKLRRLDDAREEAGSLLLKFPESKYLDDARWVLAECALIAGDWGEANRQLYWVERNATDEKLVEKARTTQQDLREYLALKNTHTKVEDAKAPLPRVGLVLPLSGDRAPEAGKFLAGFNIAWEGRGWGAPVVYDSEGDAVLAGRLMQNLAVADSVWAVVGGLSEGDAAALGALAGLYKVPFLTTVCGASGLAELDNNVFQGRPDLFRIGRELGRYAMLDAGLARFAILAPLAPGGRQVVAGFEESVKLSGGEIIAKEGYYPGAQDLSDQFERIREVGLRRTYNDSLRAMFRQKGYILIDSLRFNVPQSGLMLIPSPEGEDLEEGEVAAFTLSDALLDSLWEADHARLRKWMIQHKEEIDSLEIPLQVFDGFLMVLEPGMIAMAASQFARANLQTKLVGGEQWGNREELNKVRQYVNGIVFADPFAVLGGDDYYRFAAQVSKPAGDEVDMWHLAGERAARMIAWAFEHAALPEETQSALAQIRELETLSGRVSLLMGERVDRRVNLTKFEGGKFEAIKVKSEW